MCLQSVSVEMPSSVVYVVCALVIVGASVTYSQDNRLPSQDVPRIATKQTADEIRKLQAQFFELLESSSILKDYDNFSSTVNILKGPDGQQLIKSLVGALVPTIGREDSRDLLQHFWKQLINVFPPELSEKLIQVEQLYGNFDSLPVAIGSIIAAGDKSPIGQLLNELIPGFSVSELMQIFTVDAGGKSDVDLVTRIKNLLAPAVDKFFSDNNIDLQADAVLQIFSSLAAQFQKPSDQKDLADGRKQKNVDPMKNMMNMIMPLMGLLGTQGNANGNKMMENLMMMMMNKNSDGSNIMENIASFLGNGEGNNIMKTVMGALSGGGKNGDGNMMGMMMGLMGAMGNNKKQNDNIDMLASVIDMVAGGDSKANDMAGMAKMALNFLGDAGSKKKEKKQAKPIKKTKPDLHSNVIEKKKPVKTNQNNAHTDNKKTPNKTQR